MGEFLPLIIGISAGVIVVAITIFLIIFLTKKKKKTPALTREEIAELVSDDTFEIQVELLPPSSIPEEGKLVEIKDKKLLSKISSAIPGLSRVNKTMADASRAGDVYRAVIPAGTTLMNSASTSGAVRGIYTGATGAIEGHAELIPVAASGASAATNGVLAVMNVASFVVGQYYIRRIDGQIKEISGNISKITNFQDNEYRSRVFSLFTHIKTICDFQIEILENNELRLAKISQLDALEEECTKLLAQANLSVASFDDGNKIDYKTYEKEIKEAQNWFDYQKALLDALYKIAELRYALYLGNISREQCSSLLPTYTEQVNQSVDKLIEWHNKTMERLKVSPSENTRKRSGIDGVVHAIPGLINKKYKYRPIDEVTSEMINTQLLGHSTIHMPDTSRLYEGEVTLICKDGKYYYYPALDNNSGEQIDDNN